MKRIAEIDRLRGLCIVSMLLGHLAKDTMLSKVVHLPLWVDGAMGFVMASGVVVGIVRHRSLTSGRSLAQVTAQTWRRAAQLWLIFVVVVVVSVGLRDVTGRGTMTPTAQQFGGWARLIVDTLTLQQSLRYIDLLTVYVFALLMAPLMFGLLLRRNGALLVGLVAGGFYVLDLIVPLSAFRLENSAVIDGQVRIAQVVVATRWFSLFAVGLIMGWHWPTVDRWLRRRFVTVGLVASTVVLTVVARVTDERGMVPPSWIIDKVTLAPGTFVFAVIAVLALLRLLQTRTPSLDRPISADGPAASIRSGFGSAVGAIEVLGRFSLSAYVIHLVVIQLADLTVGMPTGSGLGLLLVVVSLLAAFGWAWLRNRPMINLPAVVSTSGRSTARSQ
ncbi:MAG: OpgC domain-containing protein [Acidimicrobiia bacterium]|nr:OpgC domain-containing protein [Acidimicrobiia bacterium]MDH5520379.1 OpgC domain-containing protein [Acidimicrobiia bacterium]